MTPLRAGRAAALALALTLLAFAGCASTRPLPAATPLDGVNRTLRSRPAALELTDGRVVREAVAVRVGPERTTWRGRHTGAHHEVATADVGRVLVRPRSLRGLAPFAGFFAGHFVGAALAEADGVGECGEMCFEGIQWWIAGLVVGTATGIGYLVASDAPEPVAVYGGPVTRYLASE